MLTVLVTPVGNVVWETVNDPNGFDPVIVVVSDIDFIVVIEYVGDPDFVFDGCVVELSV